MEEELLCSKCCGWEEEAGEAGTRQHWQWFGERLSYLSSGGSVLLDGCGGSCCCRSTLGMVRLSEKLLVLASGPGEYFRYVRFLPVASLRPWRLQ